ncbi:MAG: hypothetical protein EXS16_04020 [Gemmataceae bacterium]|nr:hypothetical protein [Gemmataceae bacterium]
MDTSTTTPTKPSATPTLLLTWSPAVQLAVGAIVLACLFFLLGRWSLGGANADPAPITHADKLGPMLDLNRATKAELRLLPGLGDSLSQRVVEHRQRVGAFRSVDDLRQVSGIGPKTLERLRPYLFVVPRESFVTFDDDSEAMPIETTKPIGKGKQPAEQIDINSASQADLQKLPGIGPKLSQRILDERAKAAFKNVDELRRVSGIGPKTLEKIKPFVVVGK